jgi:hypothetical protein
MYLDPQTIIPLVKDPRHRLIAEAIINNPVAPYTTIGNDLNVSPHAVRWVREKYLADILPVKGRKGRPVTRFKTPITLTEENYNFLVAEWYKIHDPAVTFQDVINAVISDARMEAQDD